MSSPFTRAAVVVGALAVAVAAAGAAAKAHRVGAIRPDFVVAEDPAWSPDGRRIAFVATQSRADHAPRALYVMNSDSSGVRALTKRGFASGWPTWSPDGRTLAFTHWASTASTSGIYIVDADGTGLRKIVANAFHPAWGPGGKKIAFAKALDQSPIMTAAPDGTGVRLVAAPPPESGPEGSCVADSYLAPTWSPDGELVAFSVSSAGGECGFDVYIGTNRGYGGETKVLAQGWFGEPDWSPNGGRLALTSFAPEHQDERPYIVAVHDLRNHRTRYLRSGSHPRWSPDGSRLVFVRNSAIYVMNADGSKLLRLTR